MVPVESVMLTTVHFATTLSFPSGLLSPFHVPAISAAVSFAGAGAGAAAGAAIADVVSAFGGSALVHAVTMTATNSNFRIWSSRWGAVLRSRADRSEGTESAWRRWVPRSWFARRGGLA